MATARKLITADEFLTMPKGDGKKYELVRGVLVEKVATGYPHSVVVVMIATVLNLFAGPRNYGVVVAGEPGYLLEIGPDTVRCPDVAWVAPQRIPEGFRGFPNLVPDLVVEVKSPGNSYPEMQRRAEMWLSFGARQVWTADPDHCAITQRAPGEEAVILGEDDIIDGGDLLPDFTAPVWSLSRWQR